MRLAKDLANPYLCINSQEKTSGIEIINPYQLGNEYVVQVRICNTNNHISLGLHNCLGKANELIRQESIINVTVRMAPRLSIPN